MSESAIGILPAGALGVSFFYHLTQRLTNLDGLVCFIARRGSASFEQLQKLGVLRIADEHGLHGVPTDGLFRGDLLQCYENHELPELILVCPNPDQLRDVLISYVEMLERIYEAGQLTPQAPSWPMLVLTSNGIYFQRLRQLFLEKLEESTLLGRLPDLWPHLMPLIVGKLLRGVTIQTGVRENAGPETIYRPGPSGITRLAGGDATTRERCLRILTARGAWVELAADVSATRLEFDKAMVNLTTNLLGQIYAIDDVGQFKLLRVEEIVIPEHEREIREVALQVFQVGQAVRAYQKQEPFEPVWQQFLSSCRSHLSHVPSSLQWVDLKLRAGTLAPDLTPTEAWLLDPLIRYALSAQLPDTAKFFDDLRQRLLVKLRQAIHHRSVAGHR